MIAPTFSRTLISTNS